MPPIIQILLVLAVLGFCFFLLNKYAIIASPFREIITFIVVLACVFWILEIFHITHTHLFTWR